MLNDTTAATGQVGARRKAMLRDFLRSRRERIRPEEAGVPPGPGPRRVPGLRREEVAHLAGISVDYYIRFEQGRCRSASDSLLHSIARVLRLTPVEHRYLHLIAQPAAHSSDASRRRDLSPGLRLLLNNLSTPAFVLGRNLDLLAFNDPTITLFHGLETRGNYLLWLLFDLESRNLCADWSVMTREAAAMLRFSAARHPRDEELAELIDELMATSIEFRVIWARHEVDAQRSGPRRYRHPVAGEIAFHTERLEVADHPDQILIAHGLDLETSR